MGNKKLKTFDLAKIKKYISNCIEIEEIKDSIICKIILLIAVALSLIFILFIIIFFIKEFNPNFNPNFSFLSGELSAILLAFSFLLFSNTLDEYLTLILIIVFVIAILSCIFFKKIEVKPDFFSDIVTFETAIVAFLIPLIFNVALWISKKYNSSIIIRIFEYNTPVLSVFLLSSSLIVITILRLQLMPIISILNLSKLQFSIGLISSLFLITVFFVGYLGIWIIDFATNFEKAIDLLHQYAKRCFKSLNKKSLKQLGKDENNLADKIEKKINKLRPEIFEVQYRFNEAVKGIGTILVDEIKKGESEKLIIRKLEKIEDLVKKVFEVRRDYCYWSKEALINQIINIYKAAVELQELQNKDIIKKSVCECINLIKNHLKEEGKKLSPTGDSLFRSVIKKEVLLC